jgi:hypothetical protein
MIVNARSLGDAPGVFTTKNRPSSCPVVSCRGAKRRLSIVTRIARRSSQTQIGQMMMRDGMKVNATLVAVCLAACQDLTMPSSMGPDDDPMDQTDNDPADDPRDDPFLADINNSWIGVVEGIRYTFVFATKPSGKISSAVIHGNGFDPSPDPFQLDGIFCDHMVHFTAMRGPNVMSFDGVFIDIETMDLTLKESQAHVVLGCSTSGGGRCR